MWSLGDVGYIDDEGYLFLTDRVADMVNSGGVKIYPAEAEQVIGDLPSVKDVACIGVPHDELGEVLRALVVPVDPQAPPSAQELIAQTQARLSKYKCPRSVDFEDELPRQVVEIVYADVDPVLWGAAELSVRAQLGYLRDA